ncbi:MAG: ABC transporter ATP-binding protein [Alphaproteobacteria bacterium]|nr:ABC transporter ATP-binding protein [Alphaproteobacteria bacterium]
MLAVADLKASYSGIQALRGVSLDVAEGEIVGLIGPNGAGKSTLLNCISGIVRPAGGSITLDGAEIAAVPPWTVARRGLLQVPEGRQVLPELTVLENLLLGATALAGRKATYALDRVCELFPVLAERRAQRAGSLSGGQQQMLAIGRALMGGPRLLLLDEPSLGLAPLIVRQVFDALKALNAGGLTILLVEQNARQALDATNRAYVIEQGRVVHAGPSANLAQDPDIIAHYLGQAKSDRKPVQ